MALNLVVVALFAVGFALRRSRLDEPDGTPVGLLVLSVVALRSWGRPAGWAGCSPIATACVVDEAAQTAAHRT